MKYTIWQNFKYQLNYSRTIVHLHANLDNIPKLQDISPFYVREMDVQNENDLRHWSEIVSNAYQDGVYDSESVHQHFNNHLFLKIIKTYFVMDGDLPIGTISIGSYKTNPNVGGDARIAVKRNYQGLGLGKYLILLGFHRLREMGIRNGESIISIKREKSILLHFHCCFVPQFNRNYIHYQKQKRFLLIRWLVNFKLKYLYKLSKKKNK